MTSRKCVKCGKPIHPLRLKVLPDTTTCVEHSTTNKWYVRPVVSGKTTYSETEIIKDQEQAERLAKMDRRLGYGSNLNKVRR